jgi:hypothetical protein
MRPEPTPGREPLERRRFYLGRVLILTSVAVPSRTLLASCVLALMGMAVSCGVEEPVETMKPVVPGASLPSPPAASPPMRPPTSSWPGVPYLEVRAYYAARHPFAESFMRTGIPDFVENKRGVILRRDQERRLIAAVTARIKPYDVFGCWYPRHAFVFYDPLDNPVAEVDICFQCLVVEGGPSSAPDLPALADLVNDLGLPIGPAGADAKTFRKDFTKSLQ